MSLESELARWAKSAAGKAQLKEGQKSILKNGGSGFGDTKSSEFYAEVFLKILRAEIALDGFTYGDYLRWTNVKYNDATAQYEIHVNFNNDILHRDSLYSERYDGVDNIVALMNKGYSAKNYVYGTMPDGRRGRSLKYRQGAHFMQSAVEHFNTQYGPYAIAELSDEYEGGTINLRF